MKVAIVTGANKGIGFEIAKKLGAAGVRVVLACRNEALGEEAAAKLRSLKQDVEFRSLDIASDASIDSFTRGVSSSYDHIDILVNNAAIQLHDRSPKIDQATRTLQVNYYGTVKVTEALLPLIRNAEAPRIVNVASQLGKLHTLTSKKLRARFESYPDADQIDDLLKEFLYAVGDGDQGAKGWSEDSFYTNYCISKVALIAYTRYLARREQDLQPGKNFLINSVCPGYCDTDLTSHQGPRSAEHGARTPAYLALWDKINGSAPSGRFFYDNSEIEW